jgi:ferrochelatase
MNSVQKLVLFPSKTAITDMTLRSARMASSSSKVKTGILMLNMGGPRNSGEVEQFLKNLFADRDIIKLPFQSRLGPLIAKRRTPSIIEKYNEIGGGSPISKWTQLQGDLMCKELDKLSPATAPHKPYVAFRYANPSTESALQELEDDGVSHVVAFSQYPQYSCTTTGSSMNAIYRYYQKNYPLKPPGPRGPDGVTWSVIDRWPTHPLLIKTFANNIRKELLNFPEEVRKKVVLLFSAHSVPQYVMNRGDPYPAEVGATVQLVMQELGWSNPYRVTWQSKVGPLPWLEPGTEQTIKALVKRGQKNLMLVPIAFVNDHIETLHELDIEYADELGKEVGAERIGRCAAPNDDPTFIDCLADIVATHLKSGEKVKPQMLMTCPMCTEQTCKHAKMWFAKVTGSLSPV